jgi:hypothetical protein
VVLARPLAVGSGGFGRRREVGGARLTVADWRLRHHALFRACRRPRGLVALLYGLRAGGQADQKTGKYCQHKSRHGVLYSEHDNLLSKRAKSLPRARPHCATNAHSFE